MAGTFFKRDGLFAHMSLIPYIIRRFPFRLSLAHDSRRVSNGASGDMNQNPESRVIGCIRVRLPIAAMSISMRAKYALMLERNLYW